MPVNTSKLLEIREARPLEAGALSQLAVRSKAHWGYSQDFLDACRAELTVEESRIGTDDYRCFVSVDGDSMTGFYALEHAHAGVWELDALFVEPDHIGNGIGRALVQHAIRQATAAGADRLIIQGDPNAAAFYFAIGAKKVGTRASRSISGRDLPVFEIDIAKSDAGNARCRPP